MQPRAIRSAIETSAQVLENRPAWAFIPRLWPIQGLQVAIRTVVENLHEIERPTVVVDRIPSHRKASPIGCGGVAAYVSRGQQVCHAAVGRDAAQSGGVRISCHADKCPVRRAQPRARHVTRRVVGKERILYVDIALHRIGDDFPAADHLEARQDEVVVDIIIPAGPGLRIQRGKEGVCGHALGQECTVVIVPDVKLPLIGRDVCGGRSDEGVRVADSVPIRKIKRALR